MPVSSSSNTLMASKSQKEPLSAKWSLWSVVYDSVQAAISAASSVSTSGKVLILDDDTTAMVSVVYSTTKALQENVYLFENINKLEDLGKNSFHYDKNELAPSTLAQMTCVMIIRPTTENSLKLANEFRNPLFKSYHIFFTNSITAPYIERLARWDSPHEKIKQVAELFLDFHTARDSTFTFNLRSAARLMAHDRTWWEPVDDGFLHRMIDGLVSVAIATRCGMTGPLSRPSIRYCQESSIASTVANALDEKLKAVWSSALQSSANERLGTVNSLPSSESLILILDRRQDPITPLLNQWKYQAMVHELLGLENDRVKVPKSSGEGYEEFAFSSHNDEFLAEHCDFNFGDLGLVVKRYVEQYQAQKDLKSNISTVEDLRNFVDSYADFKKMSCNVSKHVAILHALSRKVAEANLFESSCFEQDLVSSFKEAEHHKEALAFLANPKTPPFERLRIALLFSLVYPNVSARLTKIQQSLEASGVDKKQVSLLQTTVQFAQQGFNRQQRAPTSLIAAARTAIARGLKGAANVYTQHRSDLSGKLEMIAKGSLPVAGYPFVVSPAVASLEQADVIVFIVGGITYQEAQEVLEYRKTNPNTRFVLGGTFVHNSTTFLADVAQIENSSFCKQDNTWNGGSRLSMFVDV